MPRKPEIGNVQLYPNRSLHEGDRNGYVLKFYCPIQGRRIRKNCGTRDRRDARRILRECRDRLLNGAYVDSGGAITAAQADVTAVTRRSVSRALDHADGATWQVCLDRYSAHQKARIRENSLEHSLSRIEIAGRILEGYRELRRLPEDAGIGQLTTLDALEYVQERLLAGDEGLYDYRSPMTVNTMMGAVMAFVRFCQIHDWIERVPPLSKLDVDEVMKGRPVTADEFDGMVEVVPGVVGKQSASSWVYVLQILWESAFRVGDIMNFSWDDERKIHPLWSTQKKEHSTLAIPSSQKNKKAQIIAMLPGLEDLLNRTPKEERRGWVVNPLPADNQIRKEADWFKPTPSDLAAVASEFSNSAIGRLCGVSETTVRTWLRKARVECDGSERKRYADIPAVIGAQIRQRAERSLRRPAQQTEERLTKERVSRVIALIGEKAGVVVQRANEETGRRLKYASAHDLRRGCAQRLINAGISAETLKLVLRHKDFSTTERFYGATREAQSAAAELHEKLTAARKESALVGGFVGGGAATQALTASEVAKLKALLNSI